MTTPADLWPLAGLRLSTADGLKLHLPSRDELDALALLAVEGVHDEATMPFSVPWTRVEPVERGRSVLQFHWRTLGELSPARWSLPLVVIEAGEVLGVQDLSAADFASLRTVSTGSWLGRRHHRRGIGTRMRSAALGLAFEHLGAEQAVTSAFEDNAASSGVSRAVGYRENGDEIMAVEGRRRRMVRYVLTREDWEARERPPLEVAGIDAVRPLLGC